MTARLRSLNLAPRRDVLLFVALGVAALGFAIVWALFLAAPIAQATGSTTANNFLVLGVILLLSAIAAAIPFVTSGRSETRPIARAMVRLGLGMEIFGLLVTPVGLFFESDPIISVPIGFASFLVVFFGVFIAGFGGNMLAPKAA